MILKLKKLLYKITGQEDAFTEYFLFLNLWETFYNTVVTRLRINFGVSTWDWGTRLYPYSKYVSVDANGKAYAISTKHPYFLNMFENKPTENLFDIDSHIKKTYPISFFLLIFVPDSILYVFKKINDIKMNFKYRYVKKHKYNILDTGLSPNYYDLDYRLSSAIVKNTMDFLEKDFVLNNKRYPKEIKDFYKFFKTTDIKDHEILLSKNGKKHLSNLMLHLEYLWD